jgi:coenzyme F420-dependent glucose-6-phosphate dehydrogenase
MKIGFHASHELHAPGMLLEAVRRAEGAGFAAAMCSDHFHPWTENQGESGFAWSWLGAAMQATSLSFGTVDAPGQRYHPAIIAQAAATLGEMFPGRFWVALGTGQNLNEHITGAPWPAKADRKARLREAVDVIRALWAGETVDHDCPWFKVRKARLYSRPEVPPLIYGAAITEETAEWVGGWADGLITVGSEHEGLRKVVDAFRRGGGEGKPMAFQAAISFARDREQAISAAHRHWPIVTVGLAENQDLAMPAEFDRAVSGTTPEQVAEKMRVSHEIGRHIDWLQGDAALGFDAVYLHNVGPDLVDFIDVFGEKVLPAFAGR